MVNGRTAQLMGSPDVCDCLDVIVAPGKEQLFCRALLDHLRAQGISTLELGPVRPDSTVYTHVIGAAKSFCPRGYLHTGRCCVRITIAGNLGCVPQHACSKGAARDTAQAQAP